MQMEATRLFRYFSRLEKTVKQQQLETATVGKIFLIYFLYQ